MAKNPAAILYDASGNALGITDDGGTKRLHTLSKAVLHDSSLNPLTVSAGRLHVTSAVDWTSLIIDWLKDSGDSPDMVVDGSSTPVSFTFDCDPTDDLHLLWVRVLFIPNVLKYKASTFGALPQLTNGVEVSVTSNGTKTVLGLITLSEDFDFLGTVDLETGLGENDRLALQIDFSGSVKLHSGTSDKVEIKIQDDVTSAGANSTKYFQAKAFAVKD